MPGSNLLMWYLSCDVMQKISQIATKAENISDDGSNRGILKILGVKFCTLHRRTVLPSPSILASVKSTNVNEKLAQIIVPVFVRSVVWWQRKQEWSSKKWELLNSAEKKKIKTHQTLCNQRKTFSIGSASCSKWLRRLIVPYVESSVSFE